MQTNEDEGEEGCRAVVHLASHDSNSAWMTLFFVVRVVLVALLLLLRRPCPLRSTQDHQMKPTSRMRGGRVAVVRKDRHCIRNDLRPISATLSFLSEPPSSDCSFSIIHQLFPSSLTCQTTTWNPFLPSSLHVILVLK